MGYEETIDEIQQCRPHTTATRYSNTTTRENTPRPPSAGQNAKNASTDTDTGTDTKLWA